MAFRKKSSKEKKKAKSKKTNKQNKARAAREWSFEGGVQDDPPPAENKDSAEDTGSGRQRRRTQDRDERLRRGRLTLEERTRKKKDAKKMSQKVSFKRIAFGSEENRDVDKTPKKRPRIEPAVSKNPLSITDRLQQMISRSRNGMCEAENDSQSDEEVVSFESSCSHDDDSVELETAEELSDNDESDNDESDSDVNPAEDTGGDVSDEQNNCNLGENVDNDSGDDSDDNTDNQQVFDWFFNNYADDEINNLEDSEGSKLKLVESNINLIGQETDGDENCVGSMYGESLVPESISQCMPVTISSQKSRKKSKSSGDIASHLCRGIRKLKDFPCFHKMFRSSRNDNVLGGDIASKLLGYLTTYADVLIEGRDHLNDSALLQCALQHIAFHIIFSRAKVLRNNQKIKQRLVASESENDVKQKRKSRRLQSKKPDTSASELPEESIPAPDQGYTRARVLILCPFRNSAYQIVENLRTILGQERTTVSSLEKFQVEFGPQSEHIEDMTRNKSKPDDWRSIFENNVDDDFRIGLQVNPGQGKGNGADRGANLRLYTDFFHSDIIIASPLGMRLVMEKSEGDLDVRVTCDFLSSIELAFIHQADVLLMQNWTHVDFVLKHCNMLPVTDHGVDFARIRPYFLDSHGSRHRQLILTSNFNDPQIQATYRQFAQSKAGQLRLRKHWHNGCIERVSSKVKQVFYVVPTTSIASQDEERYRFFEESILLQLTRLRQKRTLIVAPSYIDYVRIRNELIKQNVSAAFICEYSRESEISRGRSLFFQGKKDVLLYSGRAHFFRRFRIRGACHLIFYSLPEYAHFYNEIVNTLAEGESLGTSTSCVVLATKFEKMALERIVGTKQCAHMLQAHNKQGKSTFMFC